VADKLSESGVAVEYVVLTGRAGEVILDFALKNNIGLVAIASHGRADWAGQFSAAWLNMSCVTPGCRSC